MRALIWFGSALLAFMGVALLAVGIFIAAATDWQPTHRLRSDEMDRIRAANTFIETHRTAIGSLPTTSEFQKWADTAPAELRIDGVGFTYSVNLPRTYKFDWWGGNTWIRWNSDSSSSDLAEISSADYFIFGSKLLDLIVFVGFGTGALVIARKMAPMVGRRNAS